MTRKEMVLEIGVGGVEEREEELIKARIQRDPRFLEGVMK